MDVPTHPVTHGLAEDDELSDEQIEMLLKQAEVRAREKDTSGALAQIPSALDIKLPRLNTPGLPAPYVQMNGEVARVDPSRLLDDQQRALANHIRKVEDPVAVKKRKIEEKKATAGERWFNLPKTELTPELKRDLQLLKMRNVLDPHRHYKKENSKDFVPEYSQVGTIVEGPTEYFSARLQKKDRKKTFVEEVLEQEKSSGRFERKYGEIQTKKTSGKKAHYKAVKAMRKSGKISKG
ncbi:putative rrna-processing protein fcf2 protein [Lasiodiplodia theobromae]|uniref:rRNA-processing protein fcf2 n=1 Tax=Lasiodiplodia theobromae TaxID=45133 RepID=A0A5N5DGL6_9PEZI|nr:rRNA processing protein fcf2 [Lasiodiplodia theobromae]KAB2576978.1 rRNA-processing protein fcf2 [Lasiodiplodia theobromae]KAF4543644.1 rRNA processing protein fcf2 [Lasiodiplodia theobromae]KAF9631378.1 putative rrna-processing protein fcf2 protein [Lasiodiplodia theobromae]